MTFAEAEHDILAIPGYTKKNTMENTANFFEYLSDCLLKKNICSTKFADMPHVIHIAGTNGKGSVCAYVSSILTEAGFRVGMFTSPHLVRITERFCINGKPVSDELFAQACTQVRAAVGQGIAEERFVHPTFFEFLVGMAYVIFMQQQVDYLILETGLGGRKDATNLVKKPLAAVLTSIGYDHTEYLGETLEAIALEKAGIIKAGVPVIYDGTVREVSGIIQQKAAEMHAETCEVTMNNCKILKFNKKSIDFLLNCEYYNNMQISLETSAHYQIINAALAAVTIQIIDHHRIITEEMVYNGIRHMRWSGRMEWLTQRFLVDGAHNEDAIRQAIDSVLHISGKVVLLYAAVKDKNYRNIIQLLCKALQLKGVVVTQMDTPRTVVTEELSKVFRSCYDGVILEEKQIGQAVAKAEMLCEEDTIIFGTGSLYLVGELRNYFEHSL